MVLVLIISEVCPGKSMHESEWLQTATGEGSQPVGK